MKAAAPVNLRMWCKECQASTLGEDCPNENLRMTACAVCGWCPSCGTDRTNREADEY